MKIAVWLPNWVGDVVMATPALRALRDRFVGAELVGVVRRYVADVLAGSPLLDRLFVYDHKHGGSSDRRGWPFLQSLRRERFDLAVVLPNSFRSAAWAWAAGAKRIIGYARGGRSGLLTDPIPAPSQSTPHPVLDEMLQLVAQLGCRTLSRRMELATLPEHEAQLANFWRRNGIVEKTKAGRLGQRYVAINTGGTFGASAAKDWPTEHFTELARRIARDRGQTVLVVCGPSERETARRIVAEAAHPQVVGMADEPLSIGLTKAAIRHADLLVSTDSGPRHFAAAFDVPTVTLFGPTHIAWSDTFHPLATYLQLPVDCGPCQQRTCPLQHHRCMKNLSVDFVFAEVVRRLPTARPADKQAA